jgi:hypothetical protein
MPKIKKLSAVEAVRLLEEIREGAKAGVKHESSADVGDFTIEALEKALGNDWARTRIEIS